MILHTAKSKTILAGAIILLSAGLTMLSGDEIRWLAVGDLHNWFSSAGCEIEVGRTGATADQLDGLRYPALYTDQDMQAAKGLWIGSTNYADPVAGRTFPYKVLGVGPRTVNEGSEWMKTEYKLVAKTDQPVILVDGVSATNLVYMDNIDEVDPTIPGDRMIYNVVQTGMGVQMERKIHAFMNPFHQNYFIHEYKFTNNGKCDASGSVTHNNTLTDFMIMWQFRNGFNREACVYGLSILPQNATWGRNEVTDDMGMAGSATYDSADNLNPFRAIFAFGGKHSDNTYDNGVGGAWSAGDGHLTSAQFAGYMTLHADTSPTNTVDDVNQPSGTMYIASDLPIYNYSNNQINESLMTGQYEWMTKGHPAKSHAEELGYDWSALNLSAIGNANQWGDAIPGSAGGISISMSFGPWPTLELGQSVNIVWVEAAAGLSREEEFRIGKDYIHGVINEDAKDLAVYSGRDSLIQTFWSAYENYQSGLTVPEPPPPPNNFIISSGGDRITLTWTNNAESYSGFAGYKIYRAKNNAADSVYVLIADIPKADIEVADGMNFFEDRTPQRGFDYYYYIISYDDASNDPDGRVLFSSKFMTITTTAAYLKRMPGTGLDQIRIVPNPYNIRARNLQYGEDAAVANKISFFNLPPKCTIRIYTERGDVVKTLNHTDNSGDQSWNLITESRQTIVSGLYIAYFETPEGESIYKKFIVIR